MDAITRDLVTNVRALADAVKSQADEVGALRAKLDAVKKAVGWPVCGLRRGILATLGWMPDSTLLMSGIDKRRAQFEGLFRRNIRPVRSYAVRRDPQRAEDVVAETFATAWRRFRG
jgi:hypothetical protein